MAIQLSHPPLDRSASDNRFELGAMFEFSAVVNASLDLRFILSHFLLTLMGKLLSQRGIVLLQRKQGAFVIENVKGLPNDIQGRELAITKIPRRLMYVDREDPEKFPWILFFKDQGIYLLVPLVAQDKIVGIAGFAPSVRRTKLTAKEATYVKSLGNIAASAIEKSLIIGELNQVNRRLDGKVQELNTLFDLSKEFNSVLDPDRLIKLLSFSIMGQVGTNRFVICLEKGGSMEIVASRMEKSIAPDVCTYFQSVTSPVIVDGLTRKSDRPWQFALQELGISVLVPLLLQGKTKGMIALGEKIRGEKYTSMDLEFLASLGNLAIISLENARLFKEAIEKQRMEDELLIAKEIQRGLLPVKLPAIPHFDVAATNISSKQVGGDYYDVIDLGQHRYVIAIGDVSGKGTPASLLMANLQATIRALVPLGLSLSELTKRVNDLLCENTGLDRFITFFWGILDVDDRSMTYVCAGHNPPFLIRRDGWTERLDKGGIILGIMKTVVPYQEDTVTLRPGDVLVLFTDGVSEAMDARGMEMGEERIEQLTKSCLDVSAEGILSRIVDAVREYSKNTLQSDDITLVVIKATD